jgi:hypothetical protein
VGLSESIRHTAGETELEQIFCGERQAFTEEIAALGHELEVWRQDVDVGALGADGCVDADPAGVAACRRG